MHLGKAHLLISSEETSLGHLGGRGIVLDMRPKCFLIPVMMY